MKWLLGTPFFFCRVNVNTRVDAPPTDCYSDRYALKISFIRLNGENPGNKTTFRMVARCGQDFLESFSSHASINSINL